MAGVRGSLDQRGPTDRRRWLNICEHRGDCRGLRAGASHRLRAYGASHRDCRPESGSEVDWRRGGCDQWPAAGRPGWSSSLTREGAPAASLAPPVITGTLDGSHPEMKPKLLSLEQRRQGDGLVSKRRHSRCAGDSLDRSSARRNRSGCLCLMLRPSAAVAQAKVRRILPVACKSQFTKMAEA